MYTHYAKTDRRTSVICIFMRFTTVLHYPIPNNAAYCKFTSVTMIRILRKYRNQPYKIKNKKHIPLQLAKNFKIFESQKAKT